MLLYLLCYYYSNSEKIVGEGPISRRKVVTHLLKITIFEHIQTGLRDLASDVLPSTTSLTILAITNPPNVFLFLCSSIPMSASVIKSRVQKGKSMHKHTDVLSRSITLIVGTLFVENDCRCRLHTRKSRKKHLNCKVDYAVFEYIYLK